MTAKPPITRAMVMAAGLGTRMRPLTNDRPKPMVEVLGRTLVDHAIDRLILGGVKMVIVNVHHKAEMLKAHLAKRKDVEIRISDETESILDTGGAIAKVLDQFEGQPFFTYNSDSIWVEGMGNSMARMHARWNDAEMDALMLLAVAASSVGYEGYGDFEMDSMGVLKRRPEMKLAPFVWTGLQIVHPRLFEGAPKGRFSINPLWDKAIAKGRLIGLRLDGVWLHVGTPTGRNQAEEFLRDIVRGP
jgi:MurNAc alpha-1-phosphate uridylyltransferase